MTLIVEVQQGTEMQLEEWVMHYLISGSILSTAPVIKLSIVNLRFQFINCYTIWQFLTEAMGYSIQFNKTILHTS